MLETFTIDTFSGRVGETFVVHPDGAAAFEVRLVEVVSLGSPVLPGGRAPFSLVFAGAVLVPQAIHRVTHGEIGEFGLFLVPLGPAAGAMRYEAVFA